MHTLIGPLLKIPRIALDTPPPAQAGDHVEHSPEDGKFSSSA